MKPNLLIPAFFVSSQLLCGQSYDLQIVATAGGTGQNGGTLIEWTFGEPVIATLSAGSVILTQGFQQPRLVVTAIKTIDSLPYTIEAYSNPTGDLLLIQLKNVNSRDFWYVLYDMTGKVIGQQAFESDVTAVKMVNYPAGVYLLKIMQPEKEVKTFEVIKQKN